MHPYAHEAKASNKARMKAMARTTSQRGGMPSAAKGATQVTEPTAEEKGEGLKHGGRAIGTKPHMRLDKRARGGRIKKPGAVVNVMIGKPDGADDQGARPVPVPIPVPAGGPPAMPPGMPAGMPPGAPPMGAGAVPGMIGRKHGGRIPHTGEAMHATEKMRAKMGNKKGYASGGRVNSYPKMDAGAASAEGRLEKIKAYGKKA